MDGACLTAKSAAGQSLRGRAESRLRDGCKLPQSGRVRRSGGHAPRSWPDSEGTSHHEGCSAFRKATSRAAPDLGLRPNAMKFQVGPREIRSGGATKTDSPGRFLRREPPSGIPAALKHFPGLEHRPPVGTVPFPQHICFSLPANGPEPRHSIRTARPAQRPKGSMRCEQAEGQRISSELPEVGWTTNPPPLARVGDVGRLSND